MFRRPAALLLMALISVAACGGASASGSPAPEDTSVAEAAAVSIVGFAFAPADLTVAAGTTVTWTNQDGDAHQVKSGSGVFVTSAVLNKGDEFAVAFPDAGTFPYLCTIHPAMTGTVTVTS